MYELYRDLQRLELIMESSVGCENITASVRISDFIKGFFFRIHHNFKTFDSHFSYSEIEHYNAKHSGALKVIFSDPMIDLTDTLFPIPKGMHGTYPDTLIGLVNILTSIDAEQLYKDLIALESRLNQGVTTYDNLIKYSKERFNHDIKAIGFMFGTKGMTHTLTKQSIVDLATTKAVNNTLMTISKIFYPMVVSIPDILVKLENTHKTLNLDTDHKRDLSQVLMSLAYRLTVFGIVMGHVQALEHNFVQCLDIIQNRSSRK